MRELYEPYLLRNLRIPFLGVNLRPLSLGHLLLLHGMESAFVTGGAPSLTDLATSVFVCANQYDAAVDAMGTRALDKAMRKWQKSLGVFDFLKACAEFQKYIDEGQMIPKWRASGEASPTAIPMVQVVKVVLMHNLNFREAELMDRSWKLCVMDYMTFREVEDGALRIADQSEDAQLAAINRMTPEQFDEFFKKQKGGRGNGTV